MYQMNSHDPFGYLKHKLWLKNQKSLQFIYMKVTYHILLNFFEKGLQLCFRFHFNQKFIEEVMGF
jgi:hypothetical protein